MALRRFLLAGAMLSLFAGCAAQEQPRPVAAAEDLSAFRAPASIRPDDSSFNVTPVAPSPPPVVRPTQGRVVGEWTPSAKPRAWRYIVLHHSASPSGNAAIFDREHRNKGWDELGYHFVIDNGHGGPDGQIEVGPRWLKQKWGAHAKTPDNRYNDFGIGICFVGNFENARPTPKQLASAARLVAWLEQNYHISPTNILGHEDTGKQTLCPGRNLNVAAVKMAAGRELADAVATPITPEPAGAPPANARVAAAETEVELLQSR